MKQILLISFIFLVNCAPIKTNINLSNTNNIQIFVSNDLSHKGFNSIDAYEQFDKMSDDDFYQLEDSCKNIIVEAMQNANIQKHHQGKFAKGNAFCKIKQNNSNYIRVVIGKSANGLIICDLTNYVEYMIKKESVDYEKIVSHFPVRLDL